MNEAERQAQENRRQRDAYLAFLDRRIPELHAMGKPEWPDEPKTKGESCARSAANLAAATYPGRRARQQADREWAELQAG